MPAPSTPPEPVSPFLAACRAQRPAHPPVWFMRQAGRSLPEYRKIRDGIPMLESCLRADLVTEITLQPVRRYGVDAAILYSDIVLPLKAVGVELDIVPGVGPVLAAPVRSDRDLHGLRRLDPEDVAPVLEAIGALVAELGPTPLIGFAGAPFTLATYLIEGGPSRTHATTIALMHAEPELWHRLMARLAEISTGFLLAQVAAGVRAVQLFDSWAGVLSARDYRSFVLPHSRRVLESVGRTGVPRIHFGVGTGELLGDMASAGADVIGVDWRVPLDEASRRIGGRLPVQGNLDPALLAAPWPVLEAETTRILLEGGRAAGHVFNLGHGVPPDADPRTLARLVEFVHAFVPEGFEAQGSAHAWAERGPRRPGPVGVASGR